MIADKKFCFNKNFLSSIELLLINEKGASIIVNLAEGVQLVSFAILAGLVIISALGVVLLSNIVYSAFLLGDRKSVV